MGQLIQRSTVGSNRPLHGLNEVLFHGSPNWSIRHTTHIVNHSRRNPPLFFSSCSWGRACGLLFWQVYQFNLHEVAGRKGEPLPDILVLPAARESIREHATLCVAFSSTVGRSICAAVGLGTIPTNRTTPQWSRIGQADPWLTVDPSNTDESRFRASATLCHGRAAESNGGPPSRLSLRRRMAWCIARIRHRRTARTVRPSGGTATTAIRPASSDRLAPDGM